MMERVVDPEDGVAPGAAVPGLPGGRQDRHRPAGRPDCGCYDGTFTVSFAGFAPADDPRFTIYVVVQNPRNGGGGGSVAGPAFSKIMSFALRRYAVPPTGTQAVARCPSSGERVAADGSVSRRGERRCARPRARPEHPRGTPLDRPRGRGSADATDGVARRGDLGRRRRRPASR